MKITSFLIIVACIALAVTNPGEEAHKHAVYNKLSSEVGVQGFLGEIAGGAMESLDPLPLKYNNYVLFSTMTFTDDLVSVGLFRYVQTTNWDASADDLRVSITPGSRAAK